MDVIDKNMEELCIKYKSLGLNINTNNMLDMSTHNKSKNLYYTFFGPF
jgi:hypothetical protein